MALSLVEIKTKKVKVDVDVDMAIKESMEIKEMKNLLDAEGRETEVKLTRLLRLSLPFPLGRIDSTFPFRPLTGTPDHAHV